MIKKFLKYCVMSQDSLRKYLYKDLQKYYKKKEITHTKDYIYVIGDIPVLLVAHLDTVHRNLPKNIWYSLDHDKVMADEGIGGDDRCGVFIINELLERGYRPYLLFTTDEEVGCLGAENFIIDYPMIDVNCMIELDRRGSNDVVSYGDSNDTLVKIFETLGYKEDFGTYTDISVLCPHYLISGVNLSVGYYKAHTTNEYVVISEMIATIDKVAKFLDDKNNYNEPVIYEESNRYLDDYWGYDYLYNRKINCDFCGQVVNTSDCVETPDGVMCLECYYVSQEHYRECKSCGFITYKNDPCIWCNSKEEDE